MLLVNFRFECTGYHYSIKKVKTKNRLWQKFITFENVVFEAQFKNFLFHGKVMLHS